MCMSKPKMPKAPTPKDPILPAQPIAPQNPASLQVGRKDEDDSTSKLKAGKARKKLRIKRTDNMSTQGGSNVGGASGVQTN